MMRACVRGSSEASAHKCCSALVWAPKGLPCSPVAAQSQSKNTTIPYARKYPFVRTFMLVLYLPHTYFWQRPRTCGALRSTEVASNHKLTVTKMCEQIRMDNQIVKTNWEGERTCSRYSLSNSMSSFFSLWAKRNLQAYRRIIGD